MSTCEHICVRRVAAPMNRMTYLGRLCRLDEGDWRTSGRHGRRKRAVPSWILRCGQHSRMSGRPEGRGSSCFERRLPLCTL